MTDAPQIHAPAEAAGVAKASAPLRERLYFVAFIFLGLFLIVLNGAPGTPSEIARTLESQVADEYARRVTTVLGNILGSQKVVTQITVELNPRELAAKKVQRLSAVILIDGSYRLVRKEGARSVAPVKEFQPLAPERMAQIEELVKTTLAFQPERGDALTIQNLPLQAPVTTNPPFWAGMQTEDVLMWGIIFCGSLLAVYFMSQLIRPVQAVQPEPVIEALKPQEKKETIIAELPFSAEELRKLLESNREEVKQDPRQAARIIRHWLESPR